MNLRAAAARGTARRNGEADDEATRNAGRYIMVGLQRNAMDRKQRNGERLMDRESGAGTQKVRLT